MFTYTYMEYLLLTIPLILFAVAYHNRKKYNNLKGSGRIPDIISANRNTTIFFLLGLVSSIGVCAIIVNI